jgi:predicted DNA-binding transcriptional regulator AlpA
MARTIHVIGDNTTLWLITLNRTYTLCCDTSHHIGDGTMIEKLLTLTEVADLLRIPVATLRYWRAKGTGPHGFHIGRKVIFTQTEVLRWLAEQEGVSA